MVRDFKSALDNVDVKANKSKVIISTGKMPFNDHEKCFNALMASGVAAIIVETKITRRDIVINRRDQTKQRVDGIHPLYDTLKYSIIFPLGEDGYHLELCQTYPITGAVTTKESVVWIFIHIFMI